MSINWPSISQGSGTSTNYSANGRDGWRWNGYAWDSNKGTFRGFPAPWVIFGFDGTPSFYQTLYDAYSNATSGQTVNLFGNVTEYMNNIFLKDNVHINLNGHRLILTENPNYTMQGLDGFYDNTNNLTTVKRCRISNGVIEHTNNTWDRGIFNVTNTYLTLHLDGLTVIQKGFEGNSRLCCNVIGGLFEGHKDVSLTYQDAYYDGFIPPIVFKDVTIVGGAFQVFTTASSATVSTSIENVVSHKTWHQLVDEFNLGAINIVVGNFTSGLNLDSCVGINNYYHSDGFPTCGITVNGYYPEYIESALLSNCYGLGKHTGIFTGQTTLSNCVGEGHRFAFLTRNSGRYFNCSDVGMGVAPHAEEFIGDPPIHGWHYSLGLTAFDVDNSTYNLFIEGCAFSSGIICESGGEDFQYPLSISNSTICSNYGVAGGTLYNPGNAVNFRKGPTSSFVNIQNNVFGSNKYTNFYSNLNGNSVALKGGTGGVFLNNVFFGGGGNGFIQSNTTGVAGSTSVSSTAGPLYPQNFAGNSHMVVTLTNFDQIVNSVSSTKGNLGLRNI